MNNIILTGFMGTGKTSVGKALALKLGYLFADIDSDIVKQENRTINEIFSENGEEYFREIEKGALQRILKGSLLVVSTGGGAVIAEANRQLMRRSGIVVNLTASPDSILQRLSDETERPLLREEEKMEKIMQLLQQRELFYADADMRIDTTGKSIEDVVQEIVDRIEMGV